MKTIIYIFVVTILVCSCSPSEVNKKEEVEISSELNKFYKDTPFNIRAKASIVEDSLFVSLTNLDTTKVSYRDYHQENFLYSYSFYELYRYFEDYNYIEFKLPYKGLNHTSEQWFTNLDVKHFYILYSQNQHYVDLSKYVKENISPHTSMGIQKSLDSLKIGFSDVNFDSEFYELLSQYSFDCGKDIKVSKYKRYMFIMTLLCKRAGEPFKEEYEALKYILNECDIDTNVLNKKNIN